MTEIDDGFLVIDGVTGIILTNWTTNVDRNWILQSCLALKANYFFTIFNHQYNVINYDNYYVAMNVVSVPKIEW